VRSSTRSSFIRLLMFFQRNAPSNRRPRETGALETLSYSRIGDSVEILHLAMIETACRQRGAARAAMETRFVMVMIPFQLLMIAFERQIWIGVRVEVLRYPSFSFYLCMSTVKIIPDRKPTQKKKLRLSRVCRKSSIK
jgi:hypothetical protein